MSWSQDSQAHWSHFVAYLFPTHNTNIHLALIELITNCFPSYHPYKYWCGGALALPTLYHFSTRALKQTFGNLMPKKRNPSDDKSLLLFCISIGWLTFFNFVGHCNFNIWTVISSPFLKNFFIEAFGQVEWCGLK